MFVASVVGGTRSSPSPACMFLLKIRVVVRRSRVSFLDVLNPKFAICCKLHLLHCVERRGCFGAVSDGDVSINRCHLSKAWTKNMNAD